MTNASSMDRIPDELSRRWSISSAFLVADTHSSLIHRVMRRDGSTAIVKSLKPRGMGELPGMAFLAWRNGQGAVRLLDQVQNVCLLEDAGQMNLRDHRLIHGEAASNAIIVKTIAELHAASPIEPSGLIPLREHFGALFKRAGSSGNDSLLDVLRRAADLAEALLSNQRDVRPLHGDLHHDNIIAGSARGWLAIDPQGLIGDPAYDVANVFGNPLGAFDDIIRPDRILALASLFADATGCSEDKILRYALAHAGLSICWSLEDGGTVDESDNARERLAFFNVAAPLLISP